MHAALAWCFEIKLTSWIFKRVTWWVFWGLYVAEISSRSSSEFLLFIKCKFALGDNPWIIRQIRHVSKQHYDSRAAWLPTLLHQIEMGRKVWWQYSALRHSATLTIINCFSSNYSMTIHMWSCVWWFWTVALLSRSSWGNDHTDSVGKYSLLTRFLIPQRHQSILCMIDQMHSVQWLTHDHVLKSTWTDNSLERYKLNKTVTQRTDGTNSLKFGSCD